jgi:hypothetical protein
MPLGYLDAPTARGKLLLTGEYTLETLPSVEALEYVLQSIEIYLDEWIGWRAAPTVWKDNLRVRADGVIVIPRTPVITVDSLQITFPQVALGHEIIHLSTLHDGYAIWSPGSRLVCLGHIPYMLPYLSPGLNTYVAVEYSAGEDPLPPIFAQVVFQALRYALKESGLTGDMGFMDSPTRDTQSLSIPGVSKSWKVSAPKNQETVSDRLFSSLAKYRHNYIV